MIDLTPLDVRNKRGDFKKNLRGYDSQEVDTFLELVAERLEQLVMENLRLQERVEGLQKQVDSQSGREQAVQEALVTAQELRSDMKGQAEREAELVLSEARTEARRLTAEAEAEARTLLRDTERRLEEGQSALEELERRRKRFLKAFRQLLERELDVVQVEEEQEPLEDRPIELDLGSARLAPTTGQASELDEVAEPDEAASESAAAEESGAPRSTADEVRDALAGLEAGTADEPEDETLSLSFDEAPAPDDDERWS